MTHGFFDVGVYEATGRAFAERKPTIAERKLTIATRRGFTLIELMAVLVIVGLLAGAAVLSLREPYRAARLQESVERVALFDRQTREHARRFGRPASLVFRLDQGAMRSTGPAGDERSLALADGVKIERIVTAAGRTEFGETTIAYSTAGESTTYAACLAGAGGTRQWILFAGVTGQTTKVDDEQDVREIFSSLAAAASAHAR